MDLAAKMSTAVSSLRNVGDLDMHGPLDPPKPPGTPPTPRSGKQRLRATSSRSAIVPLSRDADVDISPQAASPEVISSLISSLSAISAPVEDHFNNLPTVEDSPRRIQQVVDREWLSAEPPPIQSGQRSKKHASRDSLTNARGFGMEYGAHEKAQDAIDGTYLRVEDAAMPPVVRLAKPSASKHTLHPSDSNQSLGPQTRRSQQSLSPEEAANIGIPNAEQLHRGSYAPSVASSTKSGRSWRSKKGDSSQEPGTKSDMRINIFSQAARRVRPAISNRSLTDGIIQTGKRGDTTPGSENGGVLTKTSSPSIGPGSPDDSVASASVINGNMVPSRHSSLRHSVNGSPAIKQKRGSRHRLSTGSRDLKELKIDPGLIEEDHQTVRRIRELQEAKERRELELRKDARRAEKSRFRDALGEPTPPPRTTSDQSSQKSFGESSSMAENRGPRVETQSIPERPEPNTSKTVRPAGPLLSMNVNSKVPSRSGSLRRIGNLKDDVLDKRKSRAISPLRHQRTLSGDSSMTFGRPDSGESVEDSVRVYLRSPRLSQKIQHPRTGRIIAFSEVGDPNGFVVICCVGMGLTRYLTAFYDELACTLKLRLITPDRPGIGESEACLDGTGTPLNWADDVTLICDYLGVSKFSLLAHSAGAIYALATALRLPQQIRGRVHLMAPWIPPSQMTSIGNSKKEALPAANVPYSQKLLRMLPASFLKAANSGFLSARSASLNNNPPKPRFAKRRSLTNQAVESPFRNGMVRQDSEMHAGSNFNGSSPEPTTSDILAHGIGVAPIRVKGSARNSIVVTAAVKEPTYDDRLTQAIWDLATTNANPAVDLIICLERRQTIGFKYVDITRSVVIHHGSKDTRVPVDNVRWLAKMMRRCELRVLEGEGHGLMASASVMGAILGEVAKEWDDWQVVTQGKGRRSEVRRDRAQSTR